MTLRAYAGVGSRSTPDAECTLMRRLGEALARRAYRLRSGGAIGADRAFQAGAMDAGGEMEIFRPDRATAPGDIAGPSLPSWPRAQEIAAQHHPAWASLAPYVRALHSRNVMQVLGPDLDSPSAFLLCWTPTFKLGAGGEVVAVSGGTGQAVRVACAFRVPVFHLAHPPHRERVEAMLRGEGGA